MKQQWIRSNAALGIIASIGVLCLGAMSGDEDGINIDATRETIEKWVETRRIISQEGRDWMLGKEILNERIELVQREIQNVRERLSEAEKSITDADRKLAEQVEDRDRLKAAQRSLHESVAALEQRTKALAARLPDAVRERVRLLIDRLPGDAESTTLELPDRYLNVIGILNDLDKFNREIAVTSEVRTLPDGASAEVTTVYLGLGQAYYIGANNAIAGIGTATESGWVWTPANEAAAQIADVIAILQNEQVAAFVQLPIDIQ
jgi:hypothetical protein